MSAAEKFLSMHRKLEREIIKYSEGGDREEGAKLSKAINRLDDLTNDPELRGTPENDARWSTVSFLRKAKLAADDAAYEARVSGRNAQIKKLREEAPVLTGYQKELAMTEIARQSRLRRGSY